MMRSLPLTLVVALAAASVAPAADKLPAGATLTKLESWPARVTLDNPFAYAQLLVTATLSGGEKIDVTRMVKVEAPARLVKVSAIGLVRPVADGSGTIKLTLAGKAAEVGVEVKGQKAAHTVSYVRDVMPVLARLGCNAGTCHGAESGKNGFKLSLRGYDPAFDYRALTDDHAGRRFNRAAPDTSLMLLKTSGAVPHVGGALTSPGEPYYEIIRSWVGDGVKFDKDSPRVKSLQLLTGSEVLPLPGSKQQLAVLATYTDGKVRDVTVEAFLDSSNTEVATVDRNATVSAVRRGEATVLARYEGAYAARSLIVMGDRTGFVWKKVPEYNWIDQLVYEKLKAVKVLPSDLCTDGEFIRRAYLDLTGTLPSAAEVRAFLADRSDSKAKREKLIDRLIGSDDFVEHWTNKWADLLSVNSKFLGANGARAYRDWVRKAVASNKPYDKFAYEVLTAKGPNLDNPAASYFKVLREPDAIMENTTQLFLAVRFNCNKCHDHPFERWTQDQYYHLAAFFADVKLAEDPRYKNQRVGGTLVEAARPLVEVVSDGKGGQVKHQRTGLVVEPKFPYELADRAVDGATRRERLAKWLTSKENQYFAKSYVNRVWAYLTGVGLIEPIDDIRAGNPPTNPKLLDRLTEEFVSSGFDTRKLMKLICTSRTYQHSVAGNRWNEDDHINYSRATARRLPAEALYDAIHKATGSKGQLPGLTPGQRAALLLDSTQDAPGGFLDLFGKPARETSCECERSASTALGPVLNLVNGPVVGEAIRDPNNAIAALLRKEKDSRKVVEEMYLAFLSRYPTEREVQAGLEALKDGEEDYQALMGEAKKRQDALDRYVAGLPAKVSAWEAGLARRPKWETVELVSATARSGAKMQRLKDGPILVSGKNAAQEAYTVVLRTGLSGITGLRLEVLPDDSLPARGPGRAGNGNFVLNELRVSAVDLGKKEKPRPAALHRAQASFSQAAFPVGNAIDNNPVTGWAIAPAFGQRQEAIFEFRQPISGPKGAQLTVTLVQRFGGDHTIGKFRLSVTTSKAPLSLSGPPPHLAAILAVEPERRTAQQKEALLAAYKAQDAELQRLQQEVGRVAAPVDRRHPGAQDLAWALINSKGFQFNY